MRWLIRRHGYYWLKIFKYYITYAKGCQHSLRYGAVKSRPIEEMYLILKPWPFRGWAIDLIGKIHLPSSVDHTFIIIATNYFTKYVEPVPVKKVEQSDMI